MNYDVFLYTDQPIPYKELLFYPIKVKDYTNFLWCVQSLLIDKNAIPDINIISMSYLEFLFHLADNGETIHLQQLLTLFTMVLHIDVDDIKLYRKNNKPYIVIKEIEYDYNDLIEIKRIILLQNDIDDIDETIQKELRDELEKAEQLKAQMSGKQPGTFEDNIICLMTAIPGLSLDDIYEMPIRKFNKALKRADHKLHYEIYLAASMSGFVTFKDKNAIKHWMSNLDETDKYKDVTMGIDELQNKIATEK